MINVETLTVQDIITAYELAGFVNTENYTSVSIRQLKFKRGHLYVDFIWQAEDWEYPLKNGYIDIHVLAEASYSSMARWAEMDQFRLKIENAIIEQAIDEL